MVALFLFQRKKAVKSEKTFFSVQTQAQNFEWNFTSYSTIIYIVITSYSNYITQSRAYDEIG